MKVSELRRRIENIGCYVTRNGANHDIYYSPVTGLKFPVSRHMSQEIPLGTQRSIEKSAGLK
ncbi:MAG: type II toxin-antitoxin system HicA family toxin [Dysgonamonadaceae bacterium]